MKSSNLLFAVAVSLAMPLTRYEKQEHLGVIAEYPATQSNATRLLVAKWVIDWSNTLFICKCLNCGFRGYLATWLWGYVATMLHSSTTLWLCRYVSFHYTTIFSEDQCDDHHYGMPVLRTRYTLRFFLPLFELSHLAMWLFSHIATVFVFAHNWVISCISM